MLAEGQLFIVAWGRAQRRPRVWRPRKSFWLKAIITDSRKVSLAFSQTD